MSSKVFISWSSEDPRVREIAEFFQAWSKCIFGDRIDFFYSEDIMPGVDSRDEIENEISAAQFAFFFLSQRTSKASWVVFEAGCLNNLLKNGNGYFLLTDISVQDFHRLCPPLSKYQASQINSAGDVEKIVKRMCEKLGISGGDRLHIVAETKQAYPELADFLKEVPDRVQLLPDRYTGLLPYGDNIDCSNNFKMPRIFSEFKKELFMVGINLNYLLNLRADQTNFVKMINVLVDNPEKRVNLCICDIWETHIRYTYDKVVAGYANTEIEGLAEVFQDKESCLYINTFIKKVAGNKYDQITGQLTIKKIETLVDTFWFVDADAINETGVMMLAPMTGLSGYDRGVFFADQKNRGSIFNHYYELCKNSFNRHSKPVWPNFS
ncbi:MAG: toll/interleukin-1 receptor domain-containing protein [Prevotellaceae bacterium]|jgi:hypothetical protein|nr:toll/interleukin-1 receptor domain-containing protein [Prevotellaceae bacterium]